MTIPAKTLKTLEYDKVIERLAKHAITLRGRDLALGLAPVCTPRARRCYILIPVCSARSGVLG